MQKKITDKNSYELISEWLETYHTSDNAYKKEKARTLIVSQMIPVVWHIAKTIARRDYDPVEDLAQAGFIGLLKAIDNYSAEKNDNFRVYAGYLIIGEMKHYIRDKLHMIRVPRHIHELTVRINSFIGSLTYEEVQSLTSDEVASALKVSKKVVDFAIEVDRRRSTVSLEDVYKDDENHLGYEEMLSNENYEDRASYEDARIIFEDVIDKLEPEDKLLIEMYYRQDMSKKQIGEALLMSQMAVNRKMKHAFENMASLIAEKKTAEPNNNSQNEDD